jgi:hypothetical protein
MKTVLLRVFSGAIGVCTGLIALLLPLLFLANELQEAESAKQYGGHGSLLGAIGGSVVVLSAAGLFGVVAYILLRFSLRGRPNDGS